MSGEHTYRDMSWPPEDRARHKAIREKFQRERPSPRDLVASGDAPPPVPFGVYLSLRAAVADLEAAREAAGLSLAEVADRSGIEEAALGRLEHGGHENPTVDTLARYAAAVGKRLTLALQDVFPQAAGS